MLPETDFSDDDIKKRFAAYYGEKRDLGDGQIPFLRQTWANLSEFVKEIKQGFSRFYNKRHNRKGFFWGDRFKSVIVEKGAQIKEQIVEKERKCNFQYAKSDRFLQRTRYFTDSGIMR